MRITKKHIWIIVGIIAAGAVIWAVRGGGSKKPPETIAVERRDITQFVSVTGHVKPAHHVELAFERAGRVREVLADVGDVVQSGDVLVRLEANDSSADVARSRAALAAAKATQSQFAAAQESQQAKLDELNAGARPETVRVKEADVASAEQGLNNYYGDVSDTLQDAFAKSDDAVRRQTDEMFLNDDQINPQLSFITADYQAESDAKSLRFTLTGELAQWNASLGTLMNDTAAQDSALTSGTSHLDHVRQFLAAMLNAVAAAKGLPQATLDIYKANLHTARTNVNTALTSVTALSQNISAQKLAVERATKDLDLTRAGATAEQRAAQEAQVRQAVFALATQQAAVAQAEAGVANALAQLAKTELKAPFDGTVTKQDAKVGEIVPVNSAVVSLISVAKYEIEAFIPEVDIAKITKGNGATLTLDAYGDSAVFHAAVTAIDPADTVIEGVATYKTTLQFTEEDARIKSGMTADVEILAAKKEGVLAVPQRAVTEKNGKKIAQVVDAAGAVRDAVVRTGLRGTDGMLEITEGLQEGEHIVVTP